MILKFDLNKKKRERKPHQPRKRNPTQLTNFKKQGNRRQPKPNSYPAPLLP